MQVVHRHLVNGCLVTNLVRFTIAHTALDAATGKPRRERVRIVVAPRLAALLRHRKPAKLSTPDDQRLVEQAALGQIGDQRSHRFVRLASELRVVALDVVVTVPAALILHAAAINLHVTHTTLDHPACCQALCGDMLAAVVVEAIKLLNVFRFLPDV